MTATKTKCYRCSHSWKVRGEWVCQAELDPAACELFDEREAQWKVDVSTEPLQAGEEVRDPRPYPSEECAPDAGHADADRLRALSTAIARVCDFNAIRTVIVLCRVGGMSYGSIGNKYGITKQAVAQHVEAVARKSRPLGRLMRCPLATDYGTREAADITALRDRWVGNIKENAKWLKKDN